MFYILHLMLTYTTLPLIYHLVASKSNKLSKFDDPASAIDTS